MPHITYHSRGYPDHKRPYYDISGVTLHMGETAARNWLYAKYVEELMTIFGVGTKETLILYLRANKICTPEEVDEFLIKRDGYMEGPGYLHFHPVCMEITALGCRKVAIDLDEFMDCLLEEDK